MKTTQLLKSALCAFVAVFFTYTIHAEAAKVLTAGGINYPIDQIAGPEAKEPTRICGNWKSLNPRVCDYWILARKCVAPEGGTCEVSVTSGDRAAICTAANKSSCIVHIRE